MTTLRVLMRTCRATSKIMMEELLELLRVSVVLLLGCSGSSCGRDPIGLVIGGSHQGALGLLRLGGSRIRIGYWLYWLCLLCWLLVGCIGGPGFLGPTFVVMWLNMHGIHRKKCSTKTMLQASQRQCSLQRAPINPRHQHVLQGTGHIAAQYRQRWSRPRVRSCRCLVKQSRRIMCSVVFVNNKTSGHGRGGRRRVGMGQGPQGI